MNELKLIELKEVADRAGVKPSTIYYYIQKGLLPKPLRMPNKGRGVKVYYHADITKKILKIRSLLQETHSIEIVREKLAIPEEEREKKLLENFKSLMKLVKDKMIGSREYDKALKRVNQLTTASTITATSDCGEGIVVKIGPEKK